jgi:hypothetical protein
MSKTVIARNLIVVLAGVTSFVGCSAQSPATPSTAPAIAAGSAGADAQGAQAVSGTYNLLFFIGDEPGGLQPIESTLNVGQYLVLRAYVTDAAGQPAPRGSVIFEYCSVKGAPAPALSCESGSGSWKHHMGVQVDASGYSPHVGWGACSTPRSIGFRFRYSSQGSGVASGSSTPKDAKWIEPPPPVIP